MTKDIWSKYFKEIERPGDAQLLSINLPSGSVAELKTGLSTMVTKWIWLGNRR